MIHQSHIEKFNSDHLLASAKYGAVGGLLGGIGNSAGRAVQKSGGDGMINNIMYPELNTFRSVGDYGNHGAAIKKEGSRRRGQDLFCAYVRLEFSHVETITD